MVMVKRDNTALGGWYAVLVAMVIVIVSCKSECAVVMLDTHCWMVMMENEGPLLRWLPQVKHEFASEDLRKVLSVW